jgi:hypothetical protein
MRNLFLTVIIISLSFSARAQFPEEIPASFQHQPKFFLNLTGCTSFIHGDWATFSGIRVGLNFNNTTKLGIGFSHLNSSVVTPIKINENELTYTTNGSLRYTYAEASFEYTVYKSEEWEFSIPVVIGGGRAHYNYISRANPGLARSPNYTAWIIQPEASVQYTILNCAGANASLGYRSPLYASPEIRGNLNSVTFSVGFQLLLYELYKMSFPEKK